MIFYALLIIFIILVILYHYYKYLENRERAEKQLQESFDNLKVVWNNLKNYFK